MTFEPNTIAEIYVEPSIKGSSTKEPSMNECKKINPNSLPTEDELDTLGPGCYVQVKSNNDCFWAEITTIDDEIITGTIHAELNSSPPQADTKASNEIQFTKEKIINLGCDNYCWC